MRFPDLVIMSINNLRRRKLRTVLTVLGVIIGTASIVVMVSLGIGLDQMFMEQISSWGSLTTINVSISYIGMGIYFMAAGICRRTKGRGAFQVSDSICTTKVS